MAKKLSKAERIEFEAQRAGDELLNGGLRARESRRYAQSSMLAGAIMVALSALVYVLLAQIPWIFPLAVGTFGALVFFASATVWLSGLSRWKLRWLAAGFR